MRLRWTGPALQDLREASDFIARDKPGAADEFVARIFETAEDLRDFPMRGREHPETGVRLLPVRGTSMTLIYEVAEDTVLIYEIRHMSRRPYGDTDA